MPSKMGKKHRDLNQDHTAYIQIHYHEIKSLRLLDNLYVVSYI